MAHLKQYNIEDSNIALFGSNVKDHSVSFLYFLADTEFVVVVVFLQIEKRVREHAGDKEPAWEEAGKITGTEIWRIEKFKVVPWQKERYGTFYSGDSYIVLHTYKQDSDSNELFYNLHFWLGEETTQDEAGTAAYKTVELDDHTSNIHGVRFMTRQVKLGAENVRQAIGGVLVLDKGSQIWQFNRKNSAGRERFKAAEFVNSIVEERQTNSQFEPIDEGESGAGTFLEELGTDDVSSIESESSSQDGFTGSTVSTTAAVATLYRVSDASKALMVTPLPPVHPSLSELDSSDIYIIDDTANLKEPAVYIWIGRGVDEGERRIGVEIAQRYLHRKENTQTMRTSVVKVNEGRESSALLRALNG
ncbi:hypothetical protein Clacol_007715 [Clathrus columnatus]|uniref:Gelsolin-like domain-containing protein n=1 Tax=Clathrus columnatus TaxID=1419009 RepID=A0AAV5ALZ5_9AGAM|nr:hypothetical protein Clacol_007715 [Clathrus columnatus]